MAHTYTFEKIVKLAGKTIFSGPQLCAQFDVISQTSDNLYSAEFKLIKKQHLSFDKLAKALKENPNEGPVNLSGWYVHRFLLVKASDALKTEMEKPTLGEKITAHARAVLIRSLGLG